MIPHPHLVRRQAAGPATVDGQHDRSNPLARFNAAIAVAITKAVGSMWCAYAFTVLALFGLPAAIDGGTAAIVQWVAQTFLQLVLLSVIMVGGNVAAAAADKRAADTFADAEAILTELVKLRADLAAK